MKLSELRARRATLLAEAEGLLTRSGDTALTGDDAERFDAITAEVDATDVLITRHEDVLRMIDNGTATVLPGTSFDAPSVHRSRDPWSPDAHRGASEVRDDALAAIERTEAPDHAKATAERLVRTTDPTRGDTLAAVWARTFGPANGIRPVPIWNSTAPAPTPASAGPATLSPLPVARPSAFRPWQEAQLARNRALPSSTVCAGRAFVVASAGLGANAA